MVEIKQIKLGCCPTMQSDAENIASANNFSLVTLNSAAEVLYNLNQGNIELALIGRKAKKGEFQGYERKLDQGYTLISRQKGMINKDVLPQIEIHTYISKDIINGQFPELKNVFYHDTLQESIEDGDVVLIGWNDWRDEFELLIPIDKSYNKVKKYRTPFLYSKNEGIIKKVKI